MYCFVKIEVIAILTCTISVNNVRNNNNNTERRSGLKHFQGNPSIIFMTNDVHRPVAAADRPLVCSVTDCRSTKEEHRQDQGAQQTN